MYNIDELSSKNISELEDIAKELGISIDKKSSQQDIVYTILDEQAKIGAAKTPMCSTTSSWPLMRRMRQRCRIPWLRR